MGIFSLLALFCGPSLPLPFEATPTFSSMDEETQISVVSKILEGFQGSNLMDVKEAILAGFQGKSPRTQIKKGDLFQALLHCCQSYSGIVEKHGISIITPSVQIVENISQEDHLGLTLEDNHSQEEFTLVKGSRKEDSTDLSASQDDICLAFKRGRCKDGNQCTAGKHPKICWSHAKNGNCDKGRNCDRGHHVFICPSSFKRRICYKSDCPYVFHLKETKRTKPVRKALSSQGTQPKTPRAPKIQGKKPSSSPSFLGDRDLKHQMEELQKVVAVLAKSISPIVQRLNSPPSQSNQQEQTHSPWLNALMRGL